MVAPAVREIIKRHPDAEFTFFTSPDGYALFQNYDPRIKNFLVNGRTPFSRRLKRVYLFFKIRKMNFNLTYCLDGDWRIRQLLKHSAGNIFKFDERNNTGVVHAAIRALNSIGVNSHNLSDIDVPFIPIEPDKYSELVEYLFDQGISDKDILIGLNPSFSGLRRKKTRKYKLWAPNNWAALSDRLYQYGLENNLPIKVAIYSLPKEKYLAEEIHSISNHPPILLVPKSDLGLFEAYLSRLNLFIGPDSGGTHLAAGVGTELIALFAITNPYDCGPVVTDMPSSVIQAENKGNSDMNLDLITVDNVFDIVKQKLEKITNK